MAGGPPIPVFVIIPVFMFVAFVAIAMKRQSTSARMLRSMARGNMHLGTQQAQMQQANAIKMEAGMASTIQPAVQQPMMAQPMMAQPMMAQPMMAQPMMAQPMMAQPMMAQPAPTCLMQPTAMADHGVQMAVPV